MIAQYSLSIVYNTQIHITHVIQYRLWCLQVLCRTQRIMLLAQCTWLKIDCAKFAICELWQCMKRNSQHFRVYAASFYRTSNKCVIATTARNKSRMKCNRWMMDDVWCKIKSLCAINLLTGILIYYRRWHSPFIFLFLFFFAGNIQCDTKISGFNCEMRGPEWGWR